MSYRFEAGYIYRRLTHSAPASGTAPTAGRRYTRFEA